MENKGIFFIGIGLIALSIAVMIITLPALSIIPSSQEALVSSLNMTVPFPPIPVPSNGTVNLAYELETSRFVEKGWTLVKAEVLDKRTGEVLQSLEGDALKQKYHPASNLTPQELKGLTRNISLPRISFWLRLDASKKIPQVLLHRLTFTASSGNISPIVLTGGETRVLFEAKPMVLGPPLKGDGWLAVETTQGYTHHFLSQFTYNGVTRVPERFAQDWLLFNTTKGDFAYGDGKKNAEWYGYGKEIIAVADGTVVKVRDGIPDNPVVGVMGSDPSGNYLILDIGNSTYADYLHFIPGTFKVKEGDYVHAGDTLGLLGNSGGSLAPHLHFQVTNGPEIFDEGIPYVLRSFNVSGQLPSGGCSYYDMILPDALIKHFVDGNCSNSSPELYSQPQHHENQIVENLAIISFSKG